MLRNNLISLLDTVFPGANRFFSSSIEKTAAKSGRIALIPGLQFMAEIGDVRRFYAQKALLPFAEKLIFLPTSSLYSQGK